MAREHSIDFSWWHRAQRAIAHGALTNSKRPSTHVLGVYPTHLAYSYGCKAVDVQGKEYVDYICGLGTNLFGFNFTPVNQAAIRAINQGNNYSLPSTLEVEAAERVKEFFPFIGKLRFLKTGSDACASALKIARAYTNRDLVLSEGYHGHDSEFVSLTPPALGVPPHSFIEKFDFSRVPNAAAVIVEPVILDNSTDRINWLKELRKECTKHGTVLIFDEIITGYRYPLHSVSRKHGITPDLICLGKAMAGGFPLSVVGGDADIMECAEYFVSSTYAGERASLAASIEVHNQLHKEYKIDDLWESGGQFIERFNSLWDKIQLRGYNSRGRFEGEAMTKALFFQECVKAGVLFGPSWFWCFPHKDENDMVFSILENVIYKIKTGKAKLEGSLPESPFSDKVRQ